MAALPGQLRAVVIDDDSDIRLLLRRTLEMQGFAVAESANGTEALLHIKEHQPDVVTLDLNLPDLDGMEVCRRLRKFSQAYVFMVTARAEEIDELMGLETGADDYISKPFSPRTVQARISAALRRHRPTPQRPTPQRRASDVVPMTAAEIAAASNGQQRRATDVDPATPGAAPNYQRRATDVDPATPGAAPNYQRRATDVDPATPTSRTQTATLRATGATRGVADDLTVLRHGPLAVEAEGRMASLDGVELDLTRTEFDLLVALTGAPRRVWTRRALLEKVWGNDWSTDEHLIEVHIGNLRRKLGDKGREPRFIRTVRGVGYRMAPAEVAA
ncbi:response regulator transcription factor [Arthrobacter sp. PAMC25284]|uniref:response regulator transcription factor n=1 Tax=Arthrobacter sp. PAMC25284 TaxID=2861279 RepID=UPI0021590041|nr:response regulator [Arthrobacter sp. PAMC25284]